MNNYDKFDNSLTKGKIPITWRMYFYKLCDFLAKVIPMGVHDPSLLELPQFIIKINAKIVSSAKYTKFNFLQKSVSIV